MITLHIVKGDPQAQKQKVWEVAALRSFLDQNFSWIKIGHKVYKKSIRSISNSIVIVRLFTNLFGIYYEVNYNLEN